MAVQLARYALGLGTTARAHYIVLHFNRVIPEGVTGTFNRVLGGSPLLLLLGPPRAALQEAIQRVGKGPYAASPRVHALRTSMVTASEREVIMWVTVMMVLLPLPRKVLGMLTLVSSPSSLWPDVM